MRRLPVAEPDERPWRSFDALDEWASASVLNAAAVFVLVIAAGTAALVALCLLGVLLLTFPGLIPAALFLVVAWAVRRFGTGWEKL